MNRSPISSARVLLLAGACASTLGCSGERHEPLRPREVVIAQIDAKFQSEVPRGFAGSVLLADHGNTLLSKGYGLADRSSQRPVTIETGFDIGSLVKPFTAAAVMKLQSEGKLRVTDAISSLLPNVPPDKARITIEQLLNHTSGLPDIVDANSNPVTYSPAFDYEPVSRDEIVRRALNARLRFEPGARSEYSNLGYSVLGVIVELASGESFERYLRRVLFEPAEMTRTGYLVPRWQRKDLAVGYGGGQAWGTPLDHAWLPDGPSWNLRGNGGMISTAQDLHKWIRALEAGTLLPPAEMEAFIGMSAHKNRRGTRTMGVAGGNDIFNACYLWYLDEHRVIVILTSSDDFKAEKLVPDVAALVRQIQPEAPLPGSRTAAH
jgi:CubicO group peptidase (beta-lactamase class C family)